ncbi:type VI secretion system tube protein Hcp [Ancylobacter sp. 6x-1]|uniref:Type VI secretion system tube protein Hcp n=1 Tax=Ancylobacter crimeensis TaxID=2579147 RepID=A0ABT0D7K3_9HYPH|nr:type VI secretion system tube protein Hcp [Ancylobacter crimeensis]MCK0195927.1 type VI secretion system tube protein Hcp [Ancylobacter crimeensis]
MAVDGYLKIGDVKGESQDAGHTDWIDVLSWSWAMQNSASGHVGGGSGVGKADVQDFHFVKKVDTSSIDLSKYLLLGKHFDKATFELMKRGGDAKPLLYYKVEFEQVYISSLSFGGAPEGGAFMENLSFNFAKFKIYYTQQTKTGSGGAKPNFGYDVAKHDES